MQVIIMKNNHREDDEQKAFMQFCAHNKELKWLFAVPNGGKRNVREAARLKAQGLKAGVHDLMLPKARGIYKGMFLEMKYGKNKLTDKQKEFAIDISAEGYCMLTCYSAGEAIEAVKMYLNLEEHESIISTYPYLSIHHVGA